MRISLFLLFSFLGLISFSESGKISGLMMETQMRSNAYHKDVPEGYFAVKGFVKQQYGSAPIYNAIVTNTAESPSVSTDSLGYYQMIFPITDTAIYCYKIGLNEIIFNGPFKSHYLMELDFYLHNPEIPVVCTKPVVYLYNATSGVELMIKPKGDFSFTYPESNGFWKLKTNNDGTLVDLNTNKTYPYIFWEGPGKNLDFKITDGELEGYLIRTDTCVAFLERVLSQIGLNEREATDFITWWAPQMIKKEYALVQFLNATEYAESIAEISVSPSVESLLRLYMYVMPLSSSDLNFNIIAPTIKSFERNGFTLVEWGGSLFPFSNDLNL